MMTSAGMGIGTPIDLINKRRKMAARPYCARNTSMPFIFMPPLCVDFTEVYEKMQLGDYFVPRQHFQASRDWRQYVWTTTLIFIMLASERRRTLKRFELLCWGLALVFSLIAGYVNLHAKEVQPPALVVLLSAFLLGYIH